MNGKASFVETDGQISAAKVDPIWGSLGAVNILEKSLSGVDILLVRHYTRSGFAVAAPGGVAKPDLNEQRPEQSTRPRVWKASQNHWGSCSNVSIF